MKILEYPQDQKLLRMPGKHVTQEKFNSSEFQDALKEMTEILKKEAGGIGLAATQVGINYNFFILNCDEQINPAPIRIFLNPKIISTGKKLIKDSEGCLSFKGLTLKINRAANLIWEYQNSNFESLQLRSEGYFARAIFHEIEHLLGILFVDRASSAERLKFEKWLKGL